MSIGQRAPGVFERLQTTDESWQGQKSGKCVADGGRFFVVDVFKVECGIDVVVEVLGVVLIVLQMIFRVGIEVDAQDGDCQVQDISLLDVVVVKND